MDAVTHMPMSPRDDPRVGYYCLPVLTRVIANVTGQEPIYTANTLRSSVGGADPPLGRHLQFMSNLGMKPKHVWVDSEGFREYVPQVVEQGVSRGWVSTEEREVFICPCGKTEFPATQSTLLEANGRYDTYKVEGERVICKLCGKLAKISCIPNLVFRIPSSGTRLASSVFPSYAKTEFEQLARFFSGKALQISRGFPRPATVVVNKRLYWIDVDFCWMPFIGMLAVDSSLEVSTLLVSHNTIKQAVLSLILAELLGCKPTKLVVITPHVVVDFSLKPRLTAEGFLEQNGSDVTRLFLTQCLGAKRKEVILKSATAYWLSEGVRNGLLNLKPHGEKPGLSTFLEENYLLSLETAAKRVRQGRVDDVSNLQRWVVKLAIQ